MKNRSRNDASLGDDARRRRKWPAGMAERQEQTFRASPRTGPVQVAGPEDESATVILFSTQHCERDFLQLFTQTTTTTLRDQKMHTSLYEMMRKRRRRRLLLLRLLVGILVALIGPDLGPQACRAVAPTIDYSHNMRVLKLPKSTQVGELIYRLRGSDGDAQSQLMFGVGGIEARQLLEVLPVASTWNEADVYLRAPLSNSNEQQQQQQQQQQFNLTLFVSDGNKTTTIDSTILVTNDESEPSASGPQLDTSEALGDPSGPSDAHQVASDASTNFSTIFPQFGSGQPDRQQQQQQQQQQQPSSLQLSPLSPFMRPTKQVFLVPENSQPGEAIGTISVRESATSELPVRFELRGRGSERFAIKYVFGPRGQSRGQLELAQPVDYEQQNLYSLKVLALNAWSNLRLDTRNVATLDILIAIGDVQDTGPVFSSSKSPRLLRVGNEMQPGQVLAQVEASDGDLADQRPIGYALDANSMLANQFFDIDKTQGIIRLRRAASELASALGQQTLSSYSSSSSSSAANEQTLVVLASELADTSSYEHLWPPMIARLELPILMVDTSNEAPRFFGGWQTQESVRSGGQPVLHGFLREPPALASTTNHHQPTSSYKKMPSNFIQDTDLASGWPQTREPLLQVQWFTNLTQAQLMIGDETIRSLVIGKARGQPIVVDFNQGSNGTFELTLEGQDARLFEVEPRFPVSKQTQVTIRAAANNSTIFDRDIYPQDSGRGFRFELVARDFGLPARQTARIKCLIELLDSNDHWPIFERDLYTFQVYESAPPGQLLGSVRAHDRDSSRAEPNNGGVSSSAQRIRYTSLTGKDANLFHLDPESGLVTLVGALDRERQSHYLLLAEARDLHSALNYTKILINVLDVNDNGPVFAQSHYDVMLQPDGRFETPLFVQAHDADEPHSANSQLAYEILAGNQQDLFSIDSLSGEIFLSANLRAPTTIQIPSILNEPIKPYTSSTGNTRLDLAGKILPNTNNNNNANREIEETTSSKPVRLNWPLVAARSAPIDETTRSNNNKTSAAVASNSLAAFGASNSASGRVQESARLQPHVDLDEQMPAIDLLLNLDSPHNIQPRTLARDAAQTAASISSAASSGHHHQSSQLFEPLKLPPVTTLVIRAHDFGIPIRSATCKVNIYNQALQSRSLSVILNGTVPELQERREQIERSFGALTGARAQIDSIDALSDSSSISVARMRLTVPTGHYQLVDLTDLTGLIQALDLRPTHGNQNLLGADQTHNSNSPHQAPAPTIHNTSGGPTYIIPTHSNSNLSATGGGLYTDSQINSFALDSSALEKKLLIYIIIVGVCILALLVIWMIYSCCHEDKIKIVEKPSRFYATRGRHSDSLEQLEEDSEFAQGKSYKRDRSTSTSTKAKQLAGPTQSNTTANSHLAINSAIGNNLAKQRQPHLLSVDSATKSQASSRPQTNGMGATKSDHLSMYNGQVWFESGAGPLKTAGNSQDAGSLMLLHDGNSSIATNEQRLEAGDRRASSAPTQNSLDSALHSVVNAKSGQHQALPVATTTITANSLGPGPQRPAGSAQGQFFPNAQGYVNNLAALDREAASKAQSTKNKSTASKRARRRKVAPMLIGEGHENGAFEADETGARYNDNDNNDPNHHHHHQKSSRSQSRTRRPDSNSSGDDSSEATCSSLASSLSEASSTCTSDLQDRERGHGRKHSHRNQNRRESVILESDQELLGFDSTGTPIIATHTCTKQATNSETGLSTLPRPRVFRAPAGATSYIVPLAGDTVMTHEEMISGAKMAPQRQSPTSIGNKKNLKQTNAKSSEKQLEQHHQQQVEAAIEQQQQQQQQTTKKHKSEKQEERAQENGLDDGKIRDYPGKQMVDVALYENHDESGEKKPAQRETGGECLRPGQVAESLMGELNERLNQVAAKKQQQMISKQKTTLTRQSADVKNDDDDEDGLTHVAASTVREGEQKLPQEGEDDANANANANANVNAKDETEMEDQQVVAAQPTNLGGAGRAESRESRETVLQSDSSRAFHDSKQQQPQRTVSGDSNISLDQMKNRELLEKQSIFAMTYSGLATDKLPR